MKEHENKLEVAQVIADISRQLDAKDLNKALENFSADAQLIIEEDGKRVLALDGKEAIRQHLTEMLEKYDLIFHNTGATSTDLISLDQSAQAATSCIAKIRTYDPAVTTDECLYYHDSLVKVGGMWYIVRRIIQIVSKSVY